MNTAPREKQQEILQLFEEMSHTLNATDSEEVFQCIVARLAELFEAQAVTIQLLDASESFLLLKAAYGLSHDDPLYKELRFQNAIEILSDTPDNTITEHFASIPDTNHPVQQKLHASPSLPILFKQKNTGLLRIFTKGNRLLSSWEAPVARACAAQIGLVNGHLQCRSALNEVIETSATFVHKLNSPLFTALGTSQLLHADSEEEKVITELDIIIESLQSLSRLVQEMAKKTEAQKTLYKKKPCNK